MRDLNRLETFEMPRLILYVLDWVVSEFSDGPDPANQELRVLFDVIRINLDFFQAEVGEVGFINTRFVIQLNSNFINDLVPSLFLDGGLDEFTLVAMDEVLHQDVLHRLDSALDRSFIIRGAVLPQQILQHVA